MAPVYGIFSTLSVIFHDHHGYMLYVRDIYESIGNKIIKVIYSFFKLMYYYISYDTKIKCTDKNKIYNSLKNKHETIHPFPLNLILPKLNFKDEVSCYRSFWDMRNGVLQYIPVKIIIVTIDLIDLHYYDRISFSAEIYYFAAFITSLSVSVAMYYLVVFFHTLDAELVKL
jgi:hypothetical protein